MKSSKIICLLLAMMLMCLPILTACDNTKNESSADAAKSGGSDLSGEYTDAKGNYVWSVKNTDWSSIGEITFLTCGVNDTYNSEIVYNEYEKYGDSTLPERINEDLKERAEKLKEVLNISLKETYVYDASRYSGEMAKTIRNGNMTGTEEYQVVVPCLYDGGSLSVEGALYDLYELEDQGLQIHAPWWNQTFNDAMTMANQLYVTIGDIGLNSNSATAALYFNLDLWNKLNFSDKYGGRDPYQIVRDGDWTIDLVFESVRNVPSSYQDGAERPVDGTFGWGGQKDDMWSIFFASGERIAKAGADGFPELSMFTERSTTVISKLQDFVNDKEHYVSGNDYFGYKGERWPMVLIRQAFTEGRALYYNASIGNVEEMGVMADHFGIVPVPKADTTQDKYYSLINPWVSNCFAIPISTIGDHLAMTIDALNVLGAVSGNTVAKDYDEVILKWMKTRDNDTVEMLFDYILPNRSCDIGMVYKWGKLDELLQQMADEENLGKFASKYEEAETAAQTALDETVSQFKKNMENKK